MTEEIIIDCAFYKDGVCASPINKTCEYCKNIDVNKCYHKQLKRLEQENKELKKIIERCNKFKINVIDADIALENAKLKEELEGAENNLAELMKENKELKKKVKKLDKMTGIFSSRLCGKYRSALEEIRDYLNTLSSIDSDFPNTETYLRIQNKINEVLE